MIKGKSKMACCDLCEGPGTVLYPVIVDPMSIDGTKHLCARCIGTIREINYDEIDTSEDSSD